MHMDVHRTLCPFYTAGKIPHEMMRSIRILFEIVFRWSFFRVCEKILVSCHPLQVLLNWSIIQYHYYCELQTTESELDLNHPQLRLRYSH